MTFSRRHFLQAGSAAAATSLLHPGAFAQGTQRHYEVKPGRWRTFEVTTRVDVAEHAAATRLWLPVPAVDSPWQQSLVSGWRSNGQAQVTHAADGRVTALAVSFPADEHAQATDPIPPERHGVLGRFSAADESRVREYLARRLRKDPRTGNR